MTTQAPSGSSTNGATALAVAHADDLVVGLQRAVEQRQAHVDALKAQLAEVEPDLKRYQKALALLTNEEPERPAAAPRRRRNTNKDIGIERIAEVELTIRRYAIDHDEFRQVDIRSLMGVRSSVTSAGFEQLRQGNIIRLARTAGNNKFYRLTREALANNDAWLREHAT